MLFMLPLFRKAWMEKLFPVKVFGAQKESNLEMEILSDEADQNGNKLWSQTLRI